MQSESALLHSLAFDGEGSATPLTDAEQIKAAPGNQLVWIHLDAGGCDGSRWRKGLIQRKVILWNANHPTGSGNFRGYQYSTTFLWVTRQ